MQEFELEIRPRLPKAPCSYGEIPLHDLDFKAIADNIPEEYDVTYMIAGRKFSYYPSTITTVLNDLCLELDLCRSRESHLMTLAGYTVLQVEFIDDCLNFLDPVKSARGDPQAQIGGSFKVEAFQAALKAAIDDVWFLIESRLRIAENDSTGLPRRK